MTDVQHITELEAIEHHVAWLNSTPGVLSLVATLPSGLKAEIWAGGRFHITGWNGREDIAWNVAEYRRRLEYLVGLAIGPDFQEWITKGDDLDQF